jgi:hypothetical protein
VEYVAFIIGIALCGGAVLAAMKLRPSKRVGAGDDVRIDPFGVGDPWRRYVAAAQSAQRRYAKIVAHVDAGPLRTRLAEIGHQVERGVQECWDIAKRGDLLDDTIRSLDGGSLRNRLEVSTDDVVRTSLQHQLGSLDRVRDARDQTDQRLNALSTRLGELVSEAAQVAADASGERTAQLGSAVDDVVTQLQALGTAVDEVNTTGRSRGFEPGAPGTTSPAT